MLKLYILLILASDPTDSQVLYTYKKLEACHQEQVNQFIYGLQTICLPVEVPVKINPLPIGPVKGD